MREFEFYLQKGEVKKVSKDIALANALLKNITKRLNSLKKLNPKDDAEMFFENSYDCIREVCDAVLAVKGYKSYSHIASITYLKKVGFNDSLIIKLDSFRAKRNGSKYYGEEILKQDSEEIEEFIKTEFKNIVHKAEKIMSEEKWEY